MRDRRSFLSCTAALIVVASCAPVETEEPKEEARDELFGSHHPGAPKINAAGFARAAAMSGAIDTTNPFFRELGTNGRACVTCHQADQGWSITPLGIRFRFELTDGLDPLFRPHDAANAPNLDVSTKAARREAYSLLLSRGLIRVGQPLKAGAEFDLVAVDDPYGWASATQMSFFRRPLAITNTAFLGSINWDGRSTIAADPTNIRQGLKNQSNGATVNHAQAAAPIDDPTREAIVDFETQLAAAQVFTWYAGYLDAAGGEGGPAAILALPFSVGMNLPPSFDPVVFTIFDAWGDESGHGLRRRRRNVAEGQAIFNNRTFGSGRTCSGCHNTPNVGGSSGLRLFDVGISSASRRRADQPLYTFRNRTTSEEIQTTDPGRANITGLWSDMNKFKVPGLRGLAARAPYFHDGSAASIGDVVDHYDTFFSIGLSSAEKRKLVAFLESL